MHKGSEGGRDTPRRGGQGGGKQEFLSGGPFPALGKLLASSNPRALGAFAGPFQSRGRGPRRLQLLLEIQGLRVCCRELYSKRIPGGSMGISIGSEFLTQGVRFGSRGVQLGTGQMSISVYGIVDLARVNVQATR
jgi:hypothetical protein